MAAPDPFVAVGNIYGGVVFPGEGGAEAARAWQYMEECMTINKVAWNFAREADMQSFKERLLRDSRFRDLVIRWRELYKHLCSCGHSHAAIRLHFAFNRVIAQVPLPPLGPPLLGPADSNADEVENLAFVSSAEASAIVESNMSYLRSERAAPLADYLAQGVVWTRYTVRQGYGVRQGPPGLPMSWEHKLVHAFFAYKCEVCGHRFRAFPLPGGGPPGGGGGDGPGGGGGGGEGGGRGGVPPRGYPPRRPPPGRALLRRDPLAVIGGCPAGTGAPGQSGQEGASRRKAACARVGVRQAMPASTRCEDIDPRGAFSASGRVRESRNAAPAAQASAECIGGTASSQSPAATQCKRGTRRQHERNLGVPVPKPTIPGKRAILEIGGLHGRTGPDCSFTPRSETGLLKAHQASGTGRRIQGADDDEGAGLLTKTRAQGKVAQKCSMTSTQRSSPQGFALPIRSMLSGRDPQRRRDSGAIS